MWGGKAAMDEAVGQRIGIGQADDKEQIYLRALRRALELGVCVTLNVRLKKYGQRLAASKSPAVLAEFADILGRAAKAYDIEQIHGEGSLLNLDHPAIRKWIEWDDQFSHQLVRHIPLRRIEAAKRYRALKG
jgi:hypothetical protein